MSVVSARDREYNGVDGVGAPMRWTQALPHAVTKAKQPWAELILVKTLEPLPQVYH